MDRYIDKKATNKCRNDDTYITWRSNIACRRLLSDEDWPRAQLVGRSETPASDRHTPSPASTRTVWLTMARRDTKTRTNHRDDFFSTHATMEV